MSNTDPILQSVLITPIVRIEMHQSPPITMLDLYKAIINV